MLFQLLVLRVRESQPLGACACACACVFLPCFEGTGFQGNRKGPMGCIPQKATTSRPSHFAMAVAWGLELAQMPRAPKTKTCRVRKDWSSLIPSSIAPKDLGSEQTPQRLHLETHSFAQTRARSSPRVCVTGAALWR